MAGVWCEPRQRHRSVCVPTQKDRERFMKFMKPNSFSRNPCIATTCSIWGKKISSLPVAAVSPDDSSEEVFLAPQVRVTVGNVIKIVFVRLPCATWTPHFLCLAHGFNYTGAQYTTENTLDFMHYHTEHTVALPLNQEPSLGAWGCADCSKRRLQCALARCPHTAGNPEAGMSWRLSLRPHPAAGSQHPRSVPCFSGRGDGDAESPGRQPSGRRSCWRGRAGVRLGCQKTAGRRPVRAQDCLWLLGTLPSPRGNRCRVLVPACTGGCQSYEVVLEKMESVETVEVHWSPGGRGCELTSSLERAVGCHQRRISPGAGRDLSNTVRGIQFGAGAMSLQHFGVISGLPSHCLNIICYWK